MWRFFHTAKQTENNAESKTAQRQNKNKHYQIDADCRMHWVVITTVLKAYCQSQFQLKSYFIPLHNGDPATKPHNPEMTPSQLKCEVC